MAIATGARRLAVCIDDFGLHQGINAAALELAELGRVSAISCMVGAPAWRDGAASLASLDSRHTDVGLHLDLTEHPLAAASRRALPTLLAISGARLIDRARLRAEVRAQLEAFEQGVGRPPAHIDGHQHVHQFPVIREVLFDALAERYPARRPWLRRTRRPAALRTGDFKPWLIEWLGSGRFSALAREKGFAQNGHLLGIYDFKGDAVRYLALLAQWIGAAQDGDLLMCHPAQGSPALDPIGPARANEHEILSGAAFGDLLAESRVAIAPLSAMQPVA